MLASGGGSNLLAIFDYLDALGSAAPAAVVLVASNRADAPALARAGARGLATAHVHQPADAAALAQLLERHDVDLIALAGYLKLVPADITARWRGAIVNIHPALLPAHGGRGMFGRAVHEAVLATGAAESGPTAHFVDSRYDRGAAIARVTVPVAPDDTPETLAARVLAAEHMLYPRAIHAVAAGWIRLDGDGRAVIADATAIANHFPSSGFPIEFLATSSSEPLPAHP